MTKEEIKIIAQKVLINIDDEDCETIISDWNLISEQLKIIDSIDGVDDVEPMNYPCDLQNDLSSLRNDDVSFVSNKQDILNNSEFHDEDYFKNKGVINYDDEV